MKFRQLAEVFQKLEKTSSRNQKTEILARLLREVDEEELVGVIYLSLGRLGPLYDRLELNLAEKMAVRVVAWATGVREEQIWQEYKELGDLGDTIYKLKTQDSRLKTQTPDPTMPEGMVGGAPSGGSKLKSPALREAGSLAGRQGAKSVSEVYEELVGVANESGVGSQERKVRRLGKLLQSLDELSAKYVVRLVVGRLRLGFSDMTVLDALSWMNKGDKSDRKALERAFNVSTDLVKIARIYKSEGLVGLDKVKAEPGIPIRVAKAERLGTMEEIIYKLKPQIPPYPRAWWEGPLAGTQNSKLLRREKEGEVAWVAVEPKLDGMRVQVHLYKLKAQSSKLKAQDSKLGLFGEESEVEVRVFSRGMEDITHQFPEIVEAGRQLRQEVGHDLILDGEAIGYDPKTGRFLPFQETVKRKRKHAVGQVAKEIPTKVFVFDLLYIDGESLSWEYWRRRERLEEVLSQFKGGVFELTRMELVATVAEMKQWFREWVKEGLEGMMCKRLDGVYQAGARNFNWVKYKKAHESQLADTLDCVVMGYYKGKGKRSQFGLGAFLVGVRHGEKLVTVAKIGTGLSDEQWREMKRRLDRERVEERPARFEVDKHLEPDVWVRPKVVVEVEADEITKSPVHTSGYALRFPRLVRFREDKGVEEATSLAELKEMIRL